MIGGIDKLTLSASASLERGHYLHLSGLSGLRKGGRVLAPGGARPMAPVDYAYVFIRIRIMNSISNIIISIICSSSSSSSSSRSTTARSATSWMASSWRRGRGALR